MLLRRTLILGLVSLTMFIHATTVTVNKWNAVKNNNWHVKFASTASIADNIVTVKGEPGNFNSVASDWIMIDSNCPISVSGFIKRNSEKSLKKTLVALDLLVKYTDGKFEFLVIKPITEKDAGQWVKSTWTFYPKKKVKNIRVLCLNYDAQADAQFKNIQIDFQDKAKISLSNQIVKLENKVALLELAELNGQVYITSFLDKTTGKEHINKSIAPRNLWNILLTNKNGGNSFEADSGDVSIKKSNNRISIIWKNVKVFQKPIDFTVVATISLHPNKPELSFRIDTNIKDSKYKLKTIIYPIVNGIKSPALANDTYLFYPQDIGREMHNPSKNLSGSLSLRYGTWFLAMQFVALYGNGNGIYFDAKDGNGWFKDFVFSKLETPKDTFRFEVQTPVPVDVKNFAVPFPVNIALFNGNWFDASMIYRQWAIKQKWCAAGPIATRKNYPHERLKIGTSVYGYGALLPQPKEIENAIKSLQRSDYSAIPDEDLYKKYSRKVDSKRLCNDVKKLMDYFETPIEVYSHPYLEPFGSGSPRFLLIPGIPESAKALLKDKCFFAPWTTIHRYDVNIPKYKNENAQQAVVITENNKLSIEVADAVMKANMCAATNYWRNGVMEYTEKLLKGNMNGIYYDELSSSGPEICYSRNHEHHPGGGNYGLESRRNIMKQLHEKFLPQYPYFYTSGEEACEYYIDVNDINSVSGSFFNDSVPAFQAVYHDYSFSTAFAAGKFYDSFCGSRYADKSGYTNLSEFAIHACQFFAWGINPNRVRFDLPKFSPITAKFTKDISKAMQDNAKYLIYGQMLRTPQIFSGNADVTTEYIWRNFGKKTFAAIWSSAWQALDGSIAIALANASHSKLAPEISYNISNSLPKFCMIRDTKTKDILYKGESKTIRFRVPVDGYSVKVLEILPLAKDDSNIKVTNNIPPVIVAVDYDLDDAIPGENHTICVSIENTQNKPVSGSINFTLPKDSWLIKPNKQLDFSLLGKQKQKYLFTVKVPLENLKISKIVYKVNVLGTPKKMEFEYPIRFGVQPLSARKKFEKKQYNVPYMNVGKGTSFPNLILGITQLDAHISQGNPIPKASAGAVWNEQGLFMSFVVEDKQHVSPQADSNIWRGDCVQLVFGKYMPDQDYHLFRNFFFAFIDNKPYVSSLEDPQAAKSVVLSVDKMNNKIVYKVYIPSHVTGTLNSGMKIPLSFTINENNGNGFTGWLEWTPGICNGFNPKAFGELILQK